MTFVDADGAAVISGISAQPTVSGMFGTADERARRRGRSRARGAKSNAERSGRAASQNSDTAA
jgi:hypothetical protein